MPWNSVSPCRQQNISKKMDDPFNIAEFKEDTIKTLHTLPRDIELYGIKYRLAGYTMASIGSIGHFAGVTCCGREESFTITGCYQSQAG